jgi:hypothetical protein
MMNNDDFIDYANSVELLDAALWCCGSFWERS